jgi:hypothetical protein
LGVSLAPRGATWRSYKLLGWKAVPEKAHENLGVYSIQNEDQTENNTKHITRHINCEYKTTIQINLLKCHQIQQLSQRFFSPTRN